MACTLSGTRGAALELAAGGSLDGTRASKCVYAARGVGFGRSRSLGRGGAFRPLLLSALLAAPAGATAPTAEPAPARGGSRPAPAAGGAAPDTAPARPELEPGEDGASTRELDAEVRAAFEAEDYATALALLERGHARTRAPKLLFNLGAVHHHLGNCEAARDYYREFVRSEPPEPGRTEAQTALRSLAPYCGDGRADAEPERTAPRAATARATTARATTAPRLGARDVAIWTLLGAGAAAGAGAWLTWSSSAGAASDLEALAREAVLRARGGETYDDCCRARALELESRVDRNRMWSRALGVTSAMLVGSGLALWLSRSEAGDLSLRHGGYTGLEYRARF